MPFQINLLNYWQRLWPVFLSNNTQKFITYKNNLKGKICKNQILPFYDFLSLIFFYLKKTNNRIIYLNH